MLIIVDSDKPVKNEYRIYEIQHSLRDILLILLEKDIPITSSIMHTPITATRNIPPSTEAIEYKNLLIINKKYCLRRLYYGFYKKFQFHI